MTDKLEKLRDFEFFAKHFLKIRTKSGSIEPFVLNKAQKYVYNQLKKQLKETGKVRAAILKGRQQGISTFIGGYYFHYTITHRGIKTFILTHEAEATKNLFDMTKRYHENLPKGLAPKSSKDSAKELSFKALDSGYSVGTAGNKGAGRSQTVQLLHGSEVAFWPHADEHAKGLMQAVGTQSDTHVIYESTANGIGNYFHSVWKAAESGKSDFIAIFVPWYWQDEYTADTTDFHLTDDEQQLLDIYADDGLTVAHLAWRRKKIYDFDKDYDVGSKQFDQEYPICAAVAFENPIDDPFIHAKYVSKARNNEVESENALVIGVDPAIGDNDRTAIIRRKGRKAFGLETLKNHNTMQVAGYVKRLIDEEKPAKVFIDCIGIGAGVVDRLQEMGYEQVIAVNVARTANDKERFANQRAEYWSEMRDWLMSEVDVEIPDSDELESDLCAPGYKHRSNGQLLLESKKEMKERGLPSPDTADALMMTFAMGQHAGESHYEPQAYDSAEFSEYFM